ncbi:MAG: CPBP family intramembrane glutamic endopeptidase [Rubrobacteraceae bacterium]
MKTAVTRHPYLFSLLTVLALFGLTFLSRTILPSAVVGNVSGLSPGELSQPSGLGQVFKSVKTADNLFWALSILLTISLFFYLHWWREAGFKVSRRRSWYLLLFPLAACALALSGGINLPPAGLLVSQFIVILLAVFGEEVVFRGVLWRALAPAGPLRAAFVTSFLSGILQLGRTLTDGPWLEAVYVTLLAFCGGFTWAALRWRTGSIWPVFVVHVALVFAASVALLGPGTYPLFLLLITVGFLIYGIFLLRS